MTVIPVKKIFFKSCRKRQQTFSATGRLDFISSAARCLLLLLACLSLTKVSCVSSSSTSTVRSNVIATNLTNVSSSNFNASSSSRSPSSPAAQVHPIQALTKNNNNNYQNNNDNVLMNNVNSFGSFERTLSPRQIKTKYGFLRGILISLPSTSSSLSASKSSPTSRPATVSINLVSSSHSNLSSVSSSRSSSNDSNSLTAVEAFLGVPYASPPLGSLRFMPPVTPSHWRGVRMANSLGASCPQRVPKHVKDLSKGREDYLKRLKPFLDNTSEDCLYLNVYLPYDRGEYCFHFLSFHSRSCASWFWVSYHHLKFYLQPSNFHYSQNFQDKLTHTLSSKPYQNFKTPAVFHKSHHYDQSQ